MRTSVFLATALLLSLFGTLNCAQAQYNNWAVGFRIGEPAGINVRKYFGEKKAFDLNVGTFGGLYGTNRSYRSGQYRSVGFSVQGHYIHYAPITKSESIRGYYGYGGQINTRRYYPVRLNGEYENALSLGVSGIGGVEFFPPNKPYSFFLETGVYVELLQAPFFLNLNSGLGLRYNF